MDGMIMYLPLITLKRYECDIISISKTSRCRYFLENVRVTVFFFFQILYTLNTF